MQLSQMPGRLAGLTMLALAALLWQAGKAPAPQRMPLSIVTDEERHDFTVEMATTDAQRARGLMHRQALPEKQGMLFLYDKTAPFAMWMKDTPLSLDMLFIDEHGRVTRVVPRATPYSTAIIPSGGPARAVLEIAGGTAERLGLEPGNHVLHAAFAP